MVNIKEKILQAALTEFLTKGKSGATTKVIAENAGVNKAMIHYYFSSKDLLFMECVKYILEKIEGTFHTIELRSITDYKMYIDNLIESYSMFIQAHDKQIIFLLWEYLNDKELLEKIKDIIGSEHLKDFIHKTKIAVRNKEIKDIDPLILYLNIISLTLSTYMILPITLTFLGHESEEKKMEIVLKRKTEIVRLLWNDIKENK